MIVDINDTSKLSSIIIIIFGLVRLMPSINILNHCVAQMSQHSYAYKELNYFIRSKKISILKNKEINIKSVTPTFLKFDEKI